MKYVFQLITAIIYILLGRNYVSDELRPEFIGGGVTLIILVVVSGIGYDAYRNRNRIVLIIHCWFLSIRGKYVRFSMSYQYKIKINDKYLLVKNSNWGHYQHVGGKYKRTNLTGKYLRDIEARDDLKLQTSGLMKDDLVLFVPAKNAVNFLDWFNSGKEREISHWREFYEELIEGKAKLLPSHVFPYVNYNFIGTVTTPLKRTPGWDCWEILQYDILELLPTLDQQKELEKLCELGDSDYIKWADEELINCLGHDNRQKKPLYSIGQHAKWVINGKWSKN